MPLRPLDEQTIRIRELITRFESCYHEADREAERIVGAIGTGRCPAESNERPYVCHARNLRLSPLYDRLGIISNTLGAFWKGSVPVESIDRNLFASLGQDIPVKRWPAASMDKTTRLQLEAPSRFLAGFQLKLMPYR